MNCDHMHVKLLSTYCGVVKLVGSIEHQKYFNFVRCHDCGADISIYARDKTENLLPPTEN